MIARVTGENNTIADYVELCQNVYAECQRHSLNKLIWVESMKQQLTSFQTEKLMNDLAAIGFESMRIAVVDLVQEHMFYNSFGATAAQSRGLQLAVLPTIEEAVVWLTSDEAD